MISQRVIKRFCMVRALREKSLNPFNCRWTIGKSEKSYEISHSHAFTLIELLIVIAIIAILGSATVLVLNPVEIIKQGRDGTRITDVENIQKSLNLTLFNNPSLVDSLLSTNIYLSLPSGSCPLSPPTGYTYVCNATSANINKTDGTGWIPLTLQNMASLPTDPNSNFYYAFIANPTTKTFTVTALLESEKQTKLSAAKDGGTDPGRFEKGDAALWARGSGLQGYWPMDEGMGSVATDISGNNRPGTLTSGPTWMTVGNCKVGNCLSFDGVDDYVSIPYSFSLSNAHGIVSISLWGKASAASATARRLFSDNCFEYGVFQSAGNRIGGGVYGEITSSTDMAVGEWYHIVVTQSQPGGLPNTEIKLYINGELISQTSRTITTENGVNDPPYMIGDDNCYSGYNFNGLIDDVKVYNRTLTADEIKSAYNAHK